MPATCQRCLTWLRFRHKGSALRQLGDEALCALQSEAHLIELWACGDAVVREAVQQVLPLVLARFPPDRVALAQEAIAHGRDWTDMPRLWPWSRPGAEGGGPPELLPPPKGQPTARRIGPRSPLCGPQCRRAAKAHQLLGHSLAGFTGQDMAAHGALAHVAAQIALTPEEARGALRPALGLLLPALQEKFHPLVQPLLAEAP